MENPLNRWREYLKEQKNVPTIGRRGRAARARREQNMLYRRALAVLLRYMPSMLNDVPDVQGFEDA